MIFEDAHWVDPTSLEVLGRTVHRIKTLPALLIVTSRPEFNAPWVGQSHVTSLTLNRLGEREAAAIIARLVGNKDLPADVLAEIVERTDGIPLFVEEMTKAVLEADSEGAARRTVAAVPSPALAVPASLHASLMARLDRLGPAKEVAQIGAAIGREFSHALLAAVVRKPEAELQSALDRLIEAGLLFRQGTPPHATYLFKHALVQDAAYGTLAARAATRAACAHCRALEALVPDIATTRPEALAHHCVEAGADWSAARSCGGGQQACVRSANTEAETMLRRALALIERLPSTSETRRDEIAFQIALMNALCVMHGWAAAPTNEATERRAIADGNKQSRSAIRSKIPWPCTPYCMAFGYVIESTSMVPKFGAGPGVAFAWPSVRKTFRQSPLVERSSAIAQVETGASESARTLLELAIAELKLLNVQIFINLFNFDFLSYAYVTSSFASYLLGYQDTCSQSPMLRLISRKNMAIYRRWS